MVVGKTHAEFAFKREISLIILGISETIYTLLLC